MDHFETAHYALRQAVTLAKARPDEVAVYQAEALQSLALGLQEALSEIRKIVRDIDSDVKSIR